MQYKELNLDASASSHPVVTEQHLLITVGQYNLVFDLCELNSGGPAGKYDDFLKSLVMY